MHACIHTSSLATPNLQKLSLSLVWHFILASNKGDQNFSPLPPFFFLKWAMSSSAPLVITNLVGRYREGETESGSRESELTKLWQDRGLLGLSRNDKGKDSQGKRKGH